MIGGIGGLKGLDPRRNKPNTSGGPTIVFTASGGKVSGPSFFIGIDNAQIKKGDLAIFCFLEASASTSLAFSPDFKLLLDWVNGAFKKHIFARRLDGTETGVTVTNNGTNCSVVLIVLRDCAGLSMASTPQGGVITNVESVGARSGGIAEADGVYLFFIGNYFSAAAINAPPASMDQIANFATYDRRIAVYSKSFRKGETIGSKFATTSSGNLSGWTGFMV